MKKAFFLCLFLLIPVSVKAIVVQTRTPTEANVERIIIGSVVKTQEGRFVMDERSRAFSSKVAKYLGTNLAEAKSHISIMTDLYFPEACGFVGTIINRYNPSPRTTDDKTLYLFYLLEEGVDSEMRDSLKLCLATLSLPEEWPDKDNKDEFFAPCFNHEYKDFVSNEFCKAKYNLDGIIWSLTHPSPRK